MCNYSDILKWWQSLTKENIMDYEAILENFQLIFAANTNRIEGVDVNYHTTREVFEGKELSSYSGPLENLFLLRNQKFASTYMTEALLKKEPLTVEFILKLHKILMYGSYDQKRWDKGERPGEFKRGDYCIGLMDMGSLPEEVPSDIEELVKEINDTDITDPVMAGAYLHCTFETIHPFADGNGRVGRALLNYFLMLHDYPPLTIYDEDKETYYMGLEVFDRTGDLEGMKKFLEEQTIKTWKNHIPFDKKQYLGNVYYMLPEASINECRTREDCDALLSRLGLTQLW